MHCFLLFSYQLTELRENAAFVSFAVYSMACGPHHRMSGHSHPKYHRHCFFYEEEASATAAEFMFDHPPGDGRSPSGCSLWAAADLKKTVAALSSRELQTKD